MFDGKTVHNLHFTTIDSTNSWAKANARQLDPHALTCITADEQTAGKGQREKTWFSPAKGNLYTTFFFVLPNDFHCVSNLGQILAFSVATVLQDLGFSPKLKWPNDILLQGKKLGGILSETISLPEGLGVVLGLGLNIQISPNELAHLDQPATSLAAHNTETVIVSMLLSNIVSRFLIDLETLHQKGFHFFYQEYNRLLAFKDESIHFTQGKVTISAICKGIDQKGYLLLEDKKGNVFAVSSGSIKPHRV